MKQIKVLHKFRDKNDYSHIYGVGEVVAFEDARANDIVARGLGEFVTPKKETAKHEPVAPAAPAQHDGGEGEGKEPAATEQKNDGTDANPDGEGKDNEDESESASPVADPDPEEKAKEPETVHEPAAPKETKKPKSNGTRKSNKKAE